MFWGEAVRHGVHIVNRVPTKGVKEMTPYEGWKGKKPTLQHLKVFGCIGHVKKPKNQTTKLSDRSVLMVYLGVEPGSKAYWMYNPKDNKVVVARDVIFEENRRWDWIVDQEKKPTSNQSWFETFFNTSIEGGAQIQSPVHGIAESPTPVFETYNSQPSNSTSPITSLRSGALSSLNTQPSNTENPMTNEDVDVDPLTYDCWISV